MRPELTFLLRPRAAAGPTQRGQLCCIVLALATAAPLSGCNAQPRAPQQAVVAGAPPPPAASPPLPAPVPAVRDAVAAPAPASPPHAPPMAPTVASSPLSEAPLGAAAAPATVLAPDPTLTLLAFADRVRGLPAAERTRELTLANAEPATTAAMRALRTAIVLMQNRAPADLARAQQLVHQIADSPAADATPLRPLARLLLARLAEQRRLEEHLDKLNNQVREQQRRIDQLNQRLEAVRAIERSMTPPRPATGAVSPPN